MKLSCHSIAAGLVAFTGLCAVLLFIILFGAGTGPLPEQALKVIVLAMCSGAVGSFLFIGATYIWLRLDQRKLLARSPLTDKEFIKSLESDALISPFVVRQVREMAARCFGPLGERLVPSDRLEGDLHLSNVSPWATENFFDDLNEWMAPLLVDREFDLASPETFGDVVIQVQRLVNGIESRSMGNT